MHLEKLHKQSCFFCSYNRLHVSPEGLRYKRIPKIPNFCESWKRHHLVRNTDFNSNKRSVLMVKASVLFSFCFSPEAFWNGKVETWAGIDVFDFVAIPVFRVCNEKRILREHSKICSQVVLHAHQRKGENIINRSFKNQKINTSQNHFLLITSIFIIKVSNRGAWRVFRRAAQDPIPM